MALTSSTPVANAMKLLQARIHKSDNAGLFLTTLVKASSVVQSNIAEALKLSQ